MTTPEQLLTTVTPGKNTITTRDVVKSPTLLATLLGLRHILGLMLSPAGAPFTGPFCVSHKLGDVNYRLTTLDTGVDARVFPVVNLQPFHSWDSVPSGRLAVPVAEEQTDAWAPNDDEVMTQIGSQPDPPAADTCFDVHGETDTGPVPVMDCDSVDRSAMSVADLDPGKTDR